MSTEQQQYSLDSQDAAIQSFYLSVLRGGDYPLGVWNRSVRGLSKSGVRSANGSLVIMVITPVDTVVARSSGLAAPPTLEHADRRFPQSSFATLSRQHLTNEVGCVSVQNWTIPLPVVFARRRVLPSSGPAAPAVSRLESACSTAIRLRGFPCLSIPQFERRAIPVEQEFDGTKSRNSTLDRSQSQSLETSTQGLRARLTCVGSRSAASNIAGGWGW
jgi:hypothetical protein